METMVTLSVETGRMEILLQLEYIHTSALTRLIADHILVLASVDTDLPILIAGLSRGTASEAMKP